MIAVLVKNPFGKTLYLCILISQSEYIKTCHWETIFWFHYFKFTVTKHGNGNDRYREILGLVVHNH